MAERFDIAFGPGDCVCTDFSDLRRLSGVNLPQEMQKILGDLLSEKPDPYSDLDLDSDTPDPGAEQSSRRGSRSGSEGSWKQISNPETKSGELPSDKLQRGATKPKTKSELPKISCLAFGSRLGEFAMIYHDGSQWLLDGNIFERLSVIEDWIIPEVIKGGKINRTPIKSRDGAKIRFFLGPENTYLIYDGSTGECYHNIQTKEFVKWIVECYQPLEKAWQNTFFKPGLAPHSLALGPNDMFCWICETDFKVSKSFQDVFPSIEKYLVFARRKNMLSQVTFAMSTYNQPGSNQPYFVLSTPDGVCVSSVPADAANVVSKSITRRAAICSAKRTRETARSTRDGSDAKHNLDLLAPELREAVALVNAGVSSGRRRPRTDNHYTMQTQAILEDLKLISADCDKNAVNADTAEWEEGSLADRVHLIMEDRSPKEPTDVVALKAEHEKIKDLLRLRIGTIAPGEEKRKLQAILAGVNPYLEPDWQPARPSQ